MRDDVTGILIKTPGGQLICCRGNKRTVILTQRIKRFSGVILLLHSRFNCWGCFPFALFFPLHIFWSTFLLRNQSDTEIIQLTNKLLCTVFPSSPGFCSRSIHFGAWVLIKCVLQEECSLNLTTKELQPTTVHDHRNISLWPEFFLVFLLFCLVGIYLINMFPKYFSSILSFLVAYKTICIFYFFF